MANEINTNISVSVNVSGQSAGGNASGYSDLTTAFIGNEQIIGTAFEPIDLGPDLGSNPIFIFIKNLDSTNFVTIDNDNVSTNFPQKVLPGKGIYLMPTSITSVYAKADTAPCKIFVCSAG